MKNKGVMISLAVIIVIGILITKGTYRFVERAPEGTTAAAVTSVMDSEDEEAAAETGAFLAEDNGGVQGREADLPVMAGGVMTEEKEVAQEESAVESISPLDTAPARSAESAMEDKAEEGMERNLSPGESVSPYKKRLLDLDSQIQKNRDSQTVSSINSSAKTAATNELRLWDSELNTIYNEILERLDREDSEKLVEEQRAWLKTRDSLAMDAAKKSQSGSMESLEYTVSLTESTRMRAYELVEIYEEILSE